MESTEAADSAMQAAYDAQKAGDFAKAYGLFSAVTHAQPANALAHLQTAILAQNAMNDDITAVYHLRAYIRLRPDTDKTELARELLDAALNRLAIAGSANGGDDAPASDPDAEFAQTIEALKQAATTSTNKSKNCKTKTNASNTKTNALQNKWI
ncbi:MAG: hypothetical protein FWG05_05885 [Kiritimatiellaeota bacterium]|nr:hypothetical protein [Kiritimatiellota bacterium]